jgi:hypothetical protein
MFMCLWRFGRAAAGRLAGEHDRELSREMRKVLKARIQFPRDHSMAGDKKQPLIP